MLKLGFILLLAFGCGSDEQPEVDREEDLPECNMTTRGDRVLVTESGEYMICRDFVWQQN
jgi:hypothetical protein